MSVISIIIVQLFSLADLPVSEVLHPPFGAALDSQNPLHCPHLRPHFLVFSSLLPQKQLLCLL